MEVVGPAKRNCSPSESPLITTFNCYTPIVATSTFLTLTHSLTEYIHLYCIYIQPTRHAKNNYPATLFQRSYNSIITTNGASCFVYKRFPAPSYPVTHLTTGVFLGRLPVSRIESRL